MRLSIHPTADAANSAAADLLAEWLLQPGVRNVMLAAGNTPLPLYQLIAKRKLDLSHLNLFALDEYVGVPRNEPRNCANLICRTAVIPWGVPESHFFRISPEEPTALPSVLAHERRICAAGGLDVVILGLGQNGHLGFNEPGSAENSDARTLDLDAISVEANRQWFGGDYAPARGVTVGMKTLLAAKRILLLAYGPHKTAAVEGMVRGNRTPKCPASLLQGHPAVDVFLDHESARRVNATQ